MKVTTADIAWAEKEADKFERQEALAEYAHTAWSGWMQYMFSKCEPIAGLGEALIIPEEFVQRWKRQMKTAYTDLPENEKESDREEAQEILVILGIDNE